MNTAQYTKSLFLVEPVTTNNDAYSTQGVPVSLKYQF